MLYCFGDTSLCGSMVGTIAILICTARRVCLLLDSHCANKVIKMPGVPSKKKHRLTNSFIGANIFSYVGERKYTEKIKEA